MAHIWHTLMKETTLRQPVDDSRADELIEIIRALHELSQFHKEMLEEFPYPDRAFPDLDLDTHPAKEDNARTRRRYELLAVHKPFYAPFRQSVDGQQGQGQMRAQWFVEQFSSVRGKLERFCAFWDCSSLLAAVPSTDLTAGGSHIPDAFESHIAVLLQDLRKSDPHGWGAGVL